ncbi:hypothetical protein Angca_009977 [Angiostrongylus cantonensis]|nr:hypothetical protein Angca_009977 [Angiostrongylus cantonensis]
MNSEVVMAGQQLDRALVNQLLKRGEYVYELFSVMVHQGSAAGGHYFAHIKNMDQGQWYCFNDTRVEPVSPEEISKSFGGSYGGWSTSNTNAYMLMYRKISKANATFIRTSDLPTHIIELKTQWKEQEAEREKQRLYQLNLVNIVVKLNMVSDNDALLNEPYVVDLPRTHILCDIYVKSLRFFEERFRSLSTFDDSFLNIRRRSRLIRVTSNRGLTINEAYVSKADLAKKIEFLLTPGRPSSLMFLLDIWRSKGIPYPVFPPNGRTIRVARVDIAARLIDPLFHIYVNPELHTVIQVKQLIASMFGDDQRAVVVSRLILERDTQTNGLLSLDSPTANFNDLLQQCFSRVPLVYCDCGSKGESLIAVEEDRMRPLSQSIMFAVLDRKKFGQLVLVELPPQEEITRAQSLSVGYLKSSRSDEMSKQDLPSSSASSSTSPYAVASSSDVSRSSSQESNVTTGGNISEIDDGCCRNTPQMSPNVSDVEEMVDCSYLARSLTTLPRNLVQEKLEPHMRERCMTESSESTAVPSTFTCTSDFAHDVIELSGVLENLLQLDVDSRLPFGQFKAWLGRKLSIDPAQFVVVKHYKEDDKGYEYNSKDDENVRSAFDNVFKIGIKLRPPLREDEKLIRIVQFDLEELNRENWKVLFECAASKETTVRDLMLQCINLYAETYGQQLQFNQIRLREMPSLNHPMKAVLDPADTLHCRGALWSNNIYFQIITDEHLIGAPGVPVLVRRFRPSTVEVSNIQEVLVDPDATSQMESFAYGVSSLSGIPVERLAFTEVGSSWERWPFALSRLAMLDGSVKFFEHPSYAPNDVIDRVGGRVIYYRDISEVPKELSIEDRKQIQIKEHGQSMSAVARRRERPLRIQMSSISEP